MTAYEMMLSESQERMLIVAHTRGREREVVDIFRKWDLDASGHRPCHRHRPDAGDPRGRDGRQHSL
ncbi:MAG: hypothetical protein WKF84_24710 [Pyrinomonadaceae bacterium]